MSASTSWPTAALDTWRALCALARTTVLFHVGGRRAVARATHRAMTAPAPTARATPADVATVWRVYRAVHRAKRLWPGTVRCLQTALVLQEVLARRGLPATVRVGVRLRSDDLEGHAWVEVAGWVLDDARLWQTFLPLPGERLQPPQVMG
jgi:hypothetical protein